MIFSITISIMRSHFLFLFLVKKPNLGSLSKFAMVVMYDSCSSCFVEMVGATELLGVSVPFCVKSVFDDFIDDFLVNNVIGDSIAVVEVDVMIR